MEESAPETPAKPKGPKLWRQRHEQYAVGIDEAYFMSWKDGEWTVDATKVRRFYKPHEANSWAVLLQEQHPNRNVRVLRCRITFQFSEEA